MQFFTSWFEQSHFMFICVPPPVQVPNKHRRHCGSVSITLLIGRRQCCPKAGFPILRAFLRQAPTVGTLHPNKGGPRRPAGKDPMGSRTRWRGNFKTRVVLVDVHCTWPLSFCGYLGFIGCPYEIHSIVTYTVLFCLSYYLSGKENCTRRSTVCTQSPYGRQHTLLLLQTFPGNILRLQR